MKWTSWNGSWKNTTFWAEASFGSGSAYRFFGLANTGAGGFYKYEFILSRTGTNSWSSDEYINGTYYANKTWTQSFSPYFLWGVNIYSRGVEDNSVFTRMDNTTVRKYVATEPTVSVQDKGSFYLVTVKNNLDTVLNDYTVGVPGAQLALTSDNVSLAISEYNFPPTISFTSLPSGLKIHKTESTLNFSLMAADPDPADQNLTTELFLDIGGGYQKIYNFKANGISYTNGKFTAKNGTTYAISVDKTSSLIPASVDNFIIKAVTKDPGNAQAEITEIISHYNNIPDITISGLIPGQKIPKHNPNLSFRIAASDLDAMHQDLDVELYLLTGEVSIRVNRFIAEGTEITDGIFKVRSKQTYDITIDKSEIIPNTVNSFSLKVVVRDSIEQGSKEISLIHDNALPTIEFTDLTNGQAIRESEKTLQFSIKITDADAVDAQLDTEIYIGILGAYQRVKEFRVNNILNNGDSFTAQNGQEYEIDFNKGVLIPSYVNDFTIKVIAADTCGEKGEKEISLVHYRDILAQWSLDSVKEKLAVDSAGLNNKGLIYGAALTTGIISNALQFDGIDDYMEVPLSPSLTITTGSFSVEAWVKTSDVPLANDGIVNNYRTPTTSYWGFSHLGDAVEERGKFAFSLRDENWQAGVIKTQLPLNDGLWHHLVGVRDAEQDKMRFYVDGVLVDEADAPPGNVNSGQSIFIGEHAFRYFQGCIDEVTLYACALSAQEIKEKYQKVVFLEDILITNAFNDETTHPISFGCHYNKIEFELNKIVNELKLELDLPSSIQVGNIETISYNEETITDPVVSIVNGDTIYVQQTLNPGQYSIQFLLTINGELVVKTKSYSDENDMKTNYACEKFEFSFLDFASLPDVM